MGQSKEIWNSALQLNTRRIFVSIAVAILCVCFAAYMLIPSKKAEKDEIVFVPQTSENLVLSEQTEEETKEELYDLGYKKGFHAFMAQTGKEGPEVAYKYTAQIEEHEETERYADVIDKGYVDGYHKASESGFCPR
jgi:flagellar biosynthesis/type III secretory pathway protein FliH